MTTRVERYFPEVPSRDAFVAVDVGGREITEYETRRLGHQGLAHHQIPEGLSLRIPKEYPIATVPIDRDTIEWDTLASLARSAKSIDIPDSIGVNIEVREGHADIRIDDEATLLLVEQFYLGHGEQMEVVHEGGGEGSVTITRYPLGIISSSRLMGYEKIAPGATFHLQKPLEAEAIIGA